jgi:mannose-1-phosphate guanylyltransferase/MurNAc alpha-1-phosphate uridylyltransferase
VSWRGLADAGRIDVVRWDGPCIDCGTPARYLAANLAASGGRPVVGAGARVDGEVVRSVVWPGARVWAGERLVDAVRAGDDVTVLVR